MKGYGHSMILLAYFRTTLSSLKMKSDLFWVKQFCRTGMGLYSAMVRARCALVCLNTGETPPVEDEGGSRVRLRSEPPSSTPCPAGIASPNRAILPRTVTNKQEHKHTHAPISKSINKYKKIKSDAPFRERAGFGRDAEHKPSVQRVSVYYEVINKVSLVFMNSETST